MLWLHVLLLFGSFARSSFSAVYLIQLRRLKTCGRLSFRHFLHVVFPSDWVVSFVLSVSLDAMKPPAKPNVIPVYYWAVAVSPPVFPGLRI